MKTFMILDRSAHMPSSCWGVYRRVGVVEVDLKLLPPGRLEPTMLSTRARGVTQIMRTWETLRYGKTSRSSYRIALAEATELCTHLNKENLP